MIYLRPIICLSGGQKFPGFGRDLPSGMAISWTGILSHNLLEWPNPGFFLTPPRASATRQRVFVPRDAVNRTEILGVVGASALRVVKPTRRKSAEEQLKMFEP